jgi:hypothetical protein
MVSDRRQRVARIVWTVLFVAGVAAIPLLNRQTQAIAPTATDGAGRFGFRLQDVARESGVDFVHQAPVFDPQLAHIMPQVASTGASVAVADFDRDGWQDFYLTNSGENSQNRLYRNGGDGRFTDVAVQLGVADVNRTGTGVSMGAVWGDYDNDGYEDLLVYKYGGARLFHNDAGKAFTDVSARAGMPAWVNANSATWLDFDRDGRLDLFIAGYWPDGVNLWRLETTRIMPESFEYANNGGRKYLLRNKGDGSFEDVTAAMGMTSKRWTLAVAAADLRGTGYPDLFFANDYGVSELYANEGGKRFVDVAETAGVGRTPKSGMNASFGDIFNDGRVAIYKSNISEPNNLIQGNDLWVPKAGPVAGEYDNLAPSLGVDLGGWSWGAQFGDLNNDGALDLYLVNGYVSAGERSSYWYDFSVISVGHSRIIGDARNWPDMRGRSFSGYQRKRVWVNDGVGRFTEVGQSVGASDTYDGRAVAFADFGNRGVLDVVVANQKGPALLYRNTVAPGRHWIDFELEGTASNRSAIGARIEVAFGGRTQRQDVLAASGFSSQNQRRIHVGLGSAAAVDRVTIVWPSGRRQEIERPAVDQLHRVKEPA